MKRIVIFLSIMLVLGLSSLYAQSESDQILSIGFNELDLSSIIENCTRRRFQINGNYSFIDGVKGRALKSDGFTTNIFVFDLKWQNCFNDFTFSAWVALQAYGWNDVAIIDARYANNLDGGGYMGINSAGYPVFSLAIEGSWKTIVGTEKIDLGEWAHVCVVYDHRQGMTLYLNGRRIASNDKTGFPSLNNHFRIARNSYDMVPDHVHRPYGAFPAKYSFDGAIDEIKGYSKALTTRQIADIFAAQKPVKKPEFVQRYLPKGPENLPDGFNAYITSLKYYPEFDAVWRGDAPEDIVVTFKNLPFRIVAWRGIRSAPCMVVKNNTLENDIWVADQSAEYFPNKEYPGNTHGCAEHMGDAQCRYSRVKLIEDNPARKVIHWRYFPTDVQYKLPYFNKLTGWPTVIDEYYYIYPDGVYTRGYHSYNDDSAPVDQYQETTIVNPPCTYPEDNVDRVAITLADESGHEKSYLRKENFRREEFPGLIKPNIQVTNIKSEYKPFIIMDPEQVKIQLYAWNTGINSYFSMWNHFPVSQQAPSDGRQAVYNDRASSTAFTWLKSTRPYRKDNRKNEYVYLTGATAASASSLVPLSKSWNHAPELVIKSKGVENKGYEKFERAYILRVTDKIKVIQGKFLVSEDRPICNLALKVENWGNDDIRIKIKGSVLPRKNYSFGFNRKMEGTDLIVFIDKDGTQPFDITIERL